MDRVSVGEDEKTLKMKGSNAATELTVKIVSFVLDVLPQCLPSGKLLLAEGGREAVGPGEGAAAG